MNSMFNNCNELKEIKGIENFTTNNVTDMSKIFQELKILLQIMLLI